MKPMPTEILPADSVWTYKPDTDEWIIEKKSGAILLSKKEATLNIISRLNQIRTNILKEAVQKQDVVDFYLLSLLPAEYLKKTAIGPEHIDGLTLYQGIVETLREEYIRRGMEELKDEAETTQWTTAIPADDFDERLKPYYKYHESGYAYAKDYDEESEPYYDYHCERCEIGLLEGDDYSVFNDEVYCMDCYDTVVQNALEEDVHYCKTHNVFVIDAGSRSMNEELKNALKALGYKVSESESHFEEDENNNNLINYTEGRKTWEEVKENLKKQLQFQFRERKPKEKASSHSVKIHKKADSAWWEAPSSFEGLTSSDYYKLFEYAPWKTAYGGPAWAEIAKTINQMEHETNWQKIALLIDHFHDLGHNTGKLLDKFPEWTKWFKNLLDLKASKDAVRQLIPLASPEVRNLVQEYYNVQRGESWRKIQYPKTDFSKSDLNAILRDQDVPPETLFNVVKYLIERQQGLNAADYLKHPNFNRKYLTQVQKLIEKNKEKFVDWALPEINDALRSRGWIKEKSLFNVGDRVKDPNSNALGTVMQVKEPGQIQVKFDNDKGAFWFGASTFQKVPTEIEALKVGDRVVLKDNAEVGAGSIVELLTSGFVSVKWDSPSEGEYPHTYEPESLEKISAIKINLQKLSKNDKIAYEGGYPTEEDSVQWGMAAPNYMSYEPWKENSQTGLREGDIGEPIVICPKCKSDKVNIESNPAKCLECGTDFVPKPDRGSDDPTVNDYSQNYEWGPQDLGRVHQHQPGDSFWQPWGTEDSEGVSSNVMMSSFGKFMQKQSSLNTTADDGKQSLRGLCTKENGWQFKCSACGGIVHHPMCKAKQSYPKDCTEEGHKKLGLESSLNRSAITKNYALYIGPALATRTITRWKAEKILKERFPDAYAKGNYSIIEEEFDTKQANLNKKAASIVEVGRTKVFINPSLIQAEALLQKAKYKSLRALIDPLTKDLYVWDADKLIHNDVAEALGIDYQQAPQPSSMHDVWAQAIYDEEQLKYLFSELRNLKTKAELQKQAHCGPCSALKMEVLHILIDLSYKDETLFPVSNIEKLAVAATELKLNNFNSLLDMVIVDHLEKREKDVGDKLPKLKNLLIALKDIAPKLGKEIEVVDKQDKPLSKKEAFKPVKNVLIICSGNTCRSPMAENILRNIRPDLNVVSRGLYAHPGLKMTPEAEEALKEQGIIYQPHLSAPVTAGDVNAADAIFVMENWQKDELVTQFPQARNKTSLIGDIEIDDPVGKSPEEYKKTRDALTKALSRFASLNKTADPKPLSNKVVTDLIPMFVDNTEPPDHKCGTCRFRMKKDGIDTCSIMKGEINLEKGTCAFWAEGEENKGPVGSQMERDTAGYIESDEEVNCGSCRHFKEGLCTLWNGKVKAEQCCMAWEGTQNKEARLDSKYWIAPDGKEFPLGGVHGAWMAQNKDLLNKYGIETKDKTVTDVWNDMTEKGWTRISNEPAGTRFIIEVADLNRLPSYLDDFIAKHFENGETITLGNGKGKYVNITDPFPSIQKAVNKELVQTRQASLDISQETQNEIASQYGPNMLVALRFYEDALTYGHDPERALDYALEEVKKMGTIIPREEFQKVFEQYKA